MFASNGGSHLHISTGLYGLLRTHPMILERGGAEAAQGERRRVLIGARLNCRVLLMVVRRLDDATRRTTPPTG